MYYIIISIIFTLFVLYIFIVCRSIPFHAANVLCVVQNHATPTSPITGCKAKAGAFTSTVYVKDFVEHFLVVKVQTTSYVRYDVVNWLYERKTSSNTNM